jgi:hypothetical protein
MYVSYPSQTLQHVILKLFSPAERKTHIDLDPL